MHYINPICDGLSYIIDKLIPFMNRYLWNRIRVVIHYVFIDRIAVRSMLLQWRHGVSDHRLLGSTFRSDAYSSSSL